MIISFIVVFLIGSIIVMITKLKRDIVTVLLVGFFVLLLFNTGNIEGFYVTTEQEMITETIIEYENNLLNLQDTSQSEGKFVGFALFGTGAAFGSNEDKLYYCFYEETQYGYKFQKISPDDQEIYLQYINDNEQPKITKEYELKKRIKIVKRKPSIWWSTITDYRKYNKLIIGDTIEENVGASNYRQVLYVPKGSIVEDYKIDME